MKILFLFITFFLCYFKLSAQEVPHKITFADMELRLSKEAIRDIQADVDALTRSEKYFQMKLERVDMYMPIIEKIFAEEGLPDDFKYLVIQESALISDAVSSSNAVGFWQFKEISALENDLRIDRIVDERKNIVSATRAAANYLKNHYKVFNNWAYALIAYQTGVGGAKSVIDERYYGAQKMPITKNTYWYLKKYLAHKVAFESVLRSSNPTYYLLAKENVQGKSLAEIAKDHQIDVELIEEYNKWLERGRIPADKNYTVIIPLHEKPVDTPYHNDRKDPFNNIPAYDQGTAENQVLINTTGKVQKNASIAHEIKVNGLDAIVAAEGYTITTLAEKAGLTEKKFRRLNDMSIRQKIEIGEIYYLEKKLNRAKYYYHTVSPGESMWSISQRYGLKLHKLYRKNRMKDPDTPTNGRVLWLRLNRPSTVEIEYSTLDQQKAPASEQKSNQQIQEAEVENTTILETENKILEASNNSIKSDSVANFPNDTTALLPISQADTLQLSAGYAAAPQDSISNESQVVAEAPEASLENKVLAPEEKKPQLMEYIIKKGDTFFSIANKFNMKISDLLSFNNLSIKDTLNIGQTILVNKQSLQTEEKSTDNESEDRSSTNSEKTHIITSGETLYGIAKTYQVNLEDLMKWNDKENYTIKEGEIIIIKLK